MILANHGVVSSSGGVSFDTDALSFITAASITDNTQKTAINTLVTDLKSANIWTKMKAIYPFVGGSAASHKWNLKDPRDLDAAYRLIFNGGWTHSSTGVLPNGTTGYAQTYVNPSTAYSVNNNTHISFYSRTNSSLVNNVEIGCNDVNNLIISTRRADQSNNTFLYSNTVSGGVGFLDSNSLGFYIANRITNQANGFKNGISKGSNTVSDNARNNREIVIGANNAISLGIIQFSSKESAFASIGDGLTDAEASNFYTAVQNYNTTLNRNV